jgi:nicotinate-nucleotide adenylyltransferase
VLTLEELRAEFPGRSLCMILGMDAFLGLPGWHRWQEILDLAHLVVVHRPGWSAPAEGTLGAVLAEREAAAPAEICSKPAGRILLQAITQLEISSSAIREQIASEREPRYLLPDNVLELITATGCYSAVPAD